ncbi:MAG: glucans biosynthesis glucosyltransferase MdoH [Rhodomicrobium sp.]
MSVSESAAPRVDSRPRLALRLTPAGIQPIKELVRRRVLFIALNFFVYAGLLWAAAQVLGAGGWTAVNIIAFAAFAVASPWTVLGFGNTVIGFWLVHFSGDPMATAAPFAALGDEDTPIRADTAVVLTIRNEDPARAILRLRVLKDSLDRTGCGDRFAYYIMSDSNQPSIFAEEEDAVACWKMEPPKEEAERIVYRRREVNSGFKGGNIREFCERWGSNYEFMLTLDADSLMSGATVVRLVRIMQAHPKMGILQSLISGMPSSSAFARMFQFGMRHGMRAYTMGQAWWTGDCGPYWGHNAIIRMRPFIDHCHLPLLPGKPPLGGHILSHDQVEAAFMRRAGYEVRVLPEECGSWDENPPNILEFIGRDLRWCQGNIQYTKLLGEPGLHAISRFQLIWAILMFLSIPAWPLLIGLLPAIAYNSKAVADYPAGLAASLYATFLVMHLSPKLAGFVEVLANAEAARYGGRTPLAASAIIETVFSLLLGAISTVGITVFMAGLVFGRSMRWNGQSRDAQGVSWRAAFSSMWPQCVVGVAICGTLYFISPLLLLLSLPLTAGYVLAVPFAVATASPRLGRLFQKVGLCGIPEDFNPPCEIQAVRRASVAGHSL